MMENNTSAPISSPQEIISVCEKVIQLIKAYYVETSLIESLTTLLENNLNQGAYQGISDYTHLAQVLTKDLQDATNDRHLYLIVPPPKMAKQASNDHYDWEQAELIQEQERNFGFTELAILEGNIGYLKVEEFMNPDRGIDTAVAAMQFLARTKALIIDLRQNGGGYGGLAEYLASYFFADEPQLLSVSYFRETTVTEYQTFTHPFVIGERCVDKPLFILVDGKTGSAAEWFAYTLQAFGKAAVVGEVTSGNANRNSFFDVNQYLRFSVSIGKPVSKATNENWEGKGVVPDIACAAEDAKTIAWEEASKA